MQRLRLSVRTLSRPTTKCLFQSVVTIQRNSHSQLRAFSQQPDIRLRRRHNHEQRPPNHLRCASSQAPSAPKDKVAGALQTASSNNTNSLSAPVNLPDDPDGILRPTHPATCILANSSIVIQRQLEMLNVFLGFEQANKYSMMDSNGQNIGYLAEQEHGIGNAMARQTFRTHRSFTTHVFDRDEKEVLRFHRPFSWISSSIKVYDATVRDDTRHAASVAVQSSDAGALVERTSAQVSPLQTSAMRVIGEAQQQWAPLKRKYNLFLSRPQSDDVPAYDLPSKTTGSKGEAHRPGPSEHHKDLQIGRTRHFNQFAYVDEPFLSWDFSLLSESGQLLGSVNRNFAGFGREIFTDTGVYALRMDAAALSAEPEHYISQSGANSAGSTPLGMTLDQRAVMLATAVSIDFDYFSRHSHAGVGGGWMPLWMPWGGAAGEAAAGTGAAEAGAAGAASGAGEAGSIEGGAAAATRAAQEGARNVGAGEGAIAGAGSLAGYEAMQRAGERRPEDAIGSTAPLPSSQPSPQLQEQDGFAPDQGPEHDQDNDDFWGPFGGSEDDAGERPSSGSGGGDGGGGGGEGDGGDGFDLNDFF